MIEINLAPNTKTMTLENFAGLDLTQLNIKFLALGALLLVLPDLFLTDLWKDEEVTLETQLNSERAEQRKVTTRLKELDSLKEQAQAFADLEKRLEQKLNVVKEIINTRQNPFKVLKYIAENIPADVWLDKLVLKDKKIEFHGRSRSYKSIGIFIENIKNSIFFNKDIKYDQPSSNGKDRFESFVLVVDVVRFE